jgi:hypothetical protein
MNINNLEKILSLSTEPEKKNDYDIWVKQNDIITFLEKEIGDENIIIYAVLPHVFIHAVLISETNLNDETVEDLLRWDHNPYSTWSFVVSSDDAWIEGPLASSSSKILSKGEQIIYARSFDGDDSRSRYFELEQKISHVLDLHYVSESNAWCNLDRLGDIAELVKIIELEELPNNGSGTIIYMNKEVLGKYTSANDSLLCRMFDFTRYKTGSFSGWGKQNEPINLSNENNLFGKLVVYQGYGSYSRGFQIANISVPKQRVIDQSWGRFTPKENKQYAIFIAQDWKNNRIAEISCDPSCLANYFTESELPFEITPAFFKPEVLLKYKSDREKYHLDTRSVSCRGTWHLETFDVNDVGQVHTYLKYLGYLPYEEQLHWKQFNEEPKAPISKRAFATDFEGKFYDEYDPLPSLKYKLEKLHREKVDWWTLRGEESIKKVHIPYTNSRDEWADEILNLDQLVVEGFNEKWLRHKAKKLGRTPDIISRSLKLMEECLIGIGFENEHAYKLMSPFHEVHNLRSVLKGHATGSEATEIKKNALKEFGSFRKHFEHICTEIDENLETITEALQE